MNNKDHEHPPKALRVLVVDDEAGFRDLWQWELNNRGITVDTATDGAEGVRMAAKTKYDVIITDITMPEMDGLKLLDEVNKTDSRTAIIIATGFGTVETAVHAMKRGAFDFVLKPYDLENLMTRVRQAVDRLSQCQQCGRLNHE